MGHSFSNLDLKQLTFSADTVASCRLFQSAVTLVEKKCFLTPVAICVLSLNRWPLVLVFDESSSSCFVGHKLQ